ncbi:MAG: hypothetical protein H0W68_02770 [Gemmatimonadaceae bacterium]|nr:hypothetical protein [Gemmatimonadaceae bacterium]
MQPNQAYVAAELRNLGDTPYTEPAAPDFRIPSYSAAYLIVGRDDAAADRRYAAMILLTPGGIKIVKGGRLDHARNEESLDVAYARLDGHWHAGKKNPLIPEGEWFACDPGVAQ